MITSGFAERISRCVRDFETGPQKPGERRPGHGWTMDVPVRITAVYNDYLAGKVWDFSASDTVGDTIYVAKPYKLQQTPFDGLTIDGLSYAATDVQARTVTEGLNIEDQVVIPEYTIEDTTYRGDIIWCRRCETGLNDPDGNAITLRDLNEDGRAWAEE